jgi:hypothetical protein
MARRSDVLGALTVLIVGASFAMPDPASAISADLAKKCRAMEIKAHPYHQPGSGPGSSQAEREYFQHCIATDGKKDD